MHNYRVGLGLGYPRKCLLHEPEAKIAVSETKRILSENTVYPKIKSQRIVLNEIQTNFCSFFARKNLVLLKYSCFRFLYNTYCKCAQYMLSFRFKIVVSLQIKLNFVQVCKTVKKVQIFYFKII